jgi:hypothetical protein
LKRPKLGSIIHRNIREMGNYGCDMGQKGKCLNGAVEFAFFRIEPDREDQCERSNKSDDCDGINYSIPKSLIEICLAKTSL